MILIILLLIISYFVLNFFVALYYFFHMHVRTSPEKWRRTGNFMKDPEYAAMFEGGNDWAIKNKDFISEESIQNDGFKLCAQYFDFGYSEAVIIVPGLNASCNYSYYYAMPYKEHGYNVLAIDSRTHGYSDGKYNTVGYKEHADLIAWANFLKNSKKMDCVVLHGLCVGASTSVFAASSKTASDCFDVLIVEGLYTNYYRHLFERCRKQIHFPPIPSTLFFTLIMKIITGVDIRKNGPVDCIRDVKIPVLFLHGKRDKYSPPKYVPAMFEKCESRRKKLVWFEKGRHSFLRYTNTESYDRSIFDFLADAAQEGGK